MENNQQQILSEIKTLMASVRNQLEELDAKIALWQQLADPQEADAPIELDFEIDMLNGVSAVVPVEEEPIVSEIETEPEPELIVPDVVEEVVVEELPSDDLPFFDIPEEIFQPEPVAADVQQSAEKQTVIDVMTEKCLWKTAIPGSPVKDVRGAIALMDRVLFINNLFGTDAMAFQEALNRINQMQTLDEAVEYLVAIHPEWDYNSQVVYSFMMAVRRKVN